MLQFLEAYATQILSLIETVVFVLVAFTLSKKLGNTKYLEGAFEKLMLKYKTESTVKKTVGQKFSHTAPVYEINSETGELVKTDKVINVDELVNSSKDSALNSVYDRFLPDESCANTVEFANHSDKRTRIDELRDSIAVCESYRSKYNLPADMDFVDILNYVDKKSKEAKQVVDTAVAVKDEKGGE